MDMEMDAIETPMVVPLRPKLEVSSDVVWFAGTTFMTGYAVAMWYWYPDMIRRNQQIADRPEDPADWATSRATGIDKTWALGTEEIKAWDTASRMQGWLFGSGWLLWIVN